jgi:hypothetical protein
MRLDDLDEPRLPNTGFAAEEHRLSHAFFDPRPALQEACDVRFSSYQGRSRWTGARFETAGALYIWQHAVKHEGLGYPTQALYAQGLTAEIRLDQSVRRSTHDYGMRRCQVLDTGGDSRGVSQSEMRLRCPMAAVAHNHQARMDAHADHELDTGVWLQLGTITLARCQNPEPCAHRPLWRILMRQRIAKVDHQTSAQIWRHIPVKARDDRRTDLVIRPHNLAVHFRVELLREAGAVDEITAHHRELTALSRGRRHHGWRRLDVLRGWGIWCGLRGFQRDRLRIGHQCPHGLLRLFLYSLLHTGDKAIAAAMQRLDAPLRLSGVSHGLAHRHQAGVQAPVANKLIGPYLFEQLVF